MYKSVLIDAQWNFTEKTYRVTGMMLTDFGWQAYSTLRNYKWQERITHDQYCGPYLFAVAKRNEYVRRGV